MYTIGYRTWLATLGCIVMEWSLINRNPGFSGGGDSLILWLFVWSLFVPVGAAISIDHLIRRRLDPQESTRSPTLCTPGTVGLLTQAILVYAATMAARVSVSSWVSEFSAIHYILHANSGTPLGQAIAPWHALTWVLTIMAVVLETVGPLIALLSAPWPLVRTLIVVVFLFFHLSIWLTIHVSIFSAAAAAMWMAFVPGWTWDRIGRAGISPRLRGSSRQLAKRSAHLYRTWQAPFRF